MDVARCLIRHSSFWFRHSDFDVFASLHLQQEGVSLLFRGQDLEVPRRVDGQSCRRVGPHPARLRIMQLDDARAHQDKRTIAQPRGRRPLRAIRGNRVIHLVLHGGHLDDRFKGASLSAVDRCLHDDDQKAGQEETSQGQRPPGAWQRGPGGSGGRLSFSGHQADLKASRPQRKRLLGLTRESFSRATVNAHHLTGPSTIGSVRAYVKDCLCIHAYADRGVDAIALV